MAKGVPWASVVDSLREQAKVQRWRLASLSVIEHWRPVASAWAMSTEDIVSAGMPFLCPPEYQSFDAQLAWAWDAVQPWADSALAAMDQMLNLSSAEVFATFTALRGAALVFPDGSVNPLLQEVLDQDEIIATLKRRDRAQRAQNRLERAKAEAEAIASAKKKKPP